MSAVAVAEPRTRDAIESLDGLYQEAARIGLTPGWVRRQKPILWAEPQPQFAPAHWRWRDARRALDAAGRLIDVALAERRNLVMRNPAGGAEFETTRTLVCAYQMILPGERAPSHRHTSHALRVIIDGKGSFSTVNGEKMPMETGDVVLTPGWCWHGHGHDGSAPAYWFDGLDVPLTHLLEPMFYEEHPDKHEKVGRLVATSPFRFTSDAIARGLDAAKPDPEAFHGRRISLAAPAMPPMGLAMERLEANTKTRRYRSTANSVFLVCEGEGETLIGEQCFAWERGDTFVAPSWTRIEHHAKTDSTLFTLTDEPLMRFCNYFRREAD